MHLFSCLLYAPASSGLTLQLRQHNPHPWPAQEGRGRSRTHWEGDAPFPELSAHKPVSRGVVRRKSCPGCGRNGEHRGQEMLQIVMTFIKSLSSLGWIWADRLLWETPHSLLPLPVMDQQLLSQPTPQPPAPFSHLICHQCHFSSQEESKICPILHGENPFAYGRRKDFFPPLNSCFSMLCLPRTDP